MTTEDNAVQALEKVVSELMLRVKELGEENRVLREICRKNGIQFTETLAAGRHRRYFSKIFSDHSGSFDPGVGGWVAP